MVVGYKELSNTICQACYKLLSEHSKKNMVRCFVRIQGTLISNAIENKLTNKDK